MKSLKKLSTQKGSMVVEASLIVPVVISCVFIVIYFAFLMYRQSLLLSVADNGAEKGAAAWDNPSKIFELNKTGKENMDDEDLYWSMFDSNKEEKLGGIKNYIEADLKRRNFVSGFIGSGSKTVDVNIDDFIVYKKLTVTINDTYRLPAARLLHVFGSEGAYSIKVKSQAVVNDPAEFIRDTDFLLDIESELEDKNPGLKNLGDKTREILDSIKNKAAQFK